MASNFLLLSVILTLCRFHLAYGCSDIEPIVEDNPVEDSYVGVIKEFSSINVLTSIVVQPGFEDYLKVEFTLDPDSGGSNIVVSTGDLFQDFLDIRRGEENLTPLITYTCQSGSTQQPTRLGVSDTNNRAPVFSGSTTSFSIQSTWDRTVPINWDSLIIVSDQDYDVKNVLASISITPDWLELEEIPLWDVANPTNPRPATYDTSLRVRIKPDADIPTDQTITVTITALDDATGTDTFSFELEIKDASRGPRLSQPFFKSPVLTEWPTAGQIIPIDVRITGDDGFTTVQLVNQPPFFELQETQPGVWDLLVALDVPEDTARDSNNVYLLEVELRLSDGSPFTSTIAVFLPLQENVCTTESPSTTAFDPVTDCPTSTCNPSTDCPTSTFNPSTDCPTSTFNPSTDCPTSTFNPSTDCPTSTFNPSTDCPTSTCNPSTDCPTTTDMIPVTDCPSTTFDPSTDCPVTDCSTTITTPGTTTECPTTFDPSTACPPTTCDPTDCPTSTTTECPTTCDPITDCPTTTTNPTPTSLTPCPTTCEPCTTTSTPPTPCPVTCEPCTTTLTPPAPCPTTSTPPTPCPVTCEPCTTSSTPRPSNCTTGPAPSEDEGSNTGLIAGIAVVGVIAGVSTIAAVYFFLQMKKAVPSVDTSWSNPDKFTVERKPPRSSFSTSKAMRASIPNIATENGFANPAFSSDPSDAAGGLEQVLSHSTPTEEVTPYATSSLVEPEPAANGTTSPSSTTPMKSALATPKEIDPDYEPLPNSVEEKIVPEKSRGVRIADEVEIMNEPEGEEENDRL